MLLCAMIYFHIQGAFSSDSQLQTIISHHLSHSSLGIPILLVSLILKLFNVASVLI